MVATSQQKRGKEGTFWWAPSMVMDELFLDRHVQVVPLLPLCVISGNGHALL
jgi:hypothetical protein